MTALQWDQVEDRTFHSGIDHGVLYIGNAAVPWNGLTGLDDSTSQTNQPYFQDGVKYLDHTIPGVFEGTLKALTYPDEFEAAQGNVDGGGLLLTGQYPLSFGLVYRTWVGDANAGPYREYALHVFYNLRAVIDSLSYDTLGSAPAPREFSWKLSSTPVVVAGHRPTAHVVLKSSDISPEAMTKIEEMLFGTDTTEAFLPSIDQLLGIIADPNQTFSMVYNDDGTFTITGPDNMVRDLGNDQFSINNPQAYFTKADTYVIPIS